VEQNEQRQRALRVVLPTRKLSGCCCFVGVEESFADLFVESGIPFEPAVRPGLLPKRHSVGCALDHADLLCSFDNNSSRSARRRILPTLVFGNASRNSICRGTL